MSAGSFLPSDYVAPTSGGGQYFKPQAGENRVRILSEPILGYVYWNLDGKPVRFPLDQNPGAKPADMRPAGSNGQAEKVKQFWALKVYNYGTKQMEIWEVTQSSIMTAITNLSKEEDWGHPKGYDLKINKSGAGLNTEYVVTPVPPKPVSDEVREAFKTTSINLQALYTGENPFGVAGSQALASATQAMTPAAAPAPAPKAAPKPAPVAAVVSPDNDNDLPF